MSPIWIKVLSICGAAAVFLLGLAVEHDQMKKDFQQHAPPPVPTAVPASEHRGGTPRRMAHALQYHEGH